MITIPSGIRVLQSRKATTLLGKTTLERSRRLSWRPPGRSNSYDRGNCALPEVTYFERVERKREKEGERVTRGEREGKASGGLPLPRPLAASFHELLPTRGFVSLPGGRGILLLTYRSPPIQPREPLAHVYPHAHHRHPFGAL